MAQIIQALAGTNSLKPVFFIRLRGYLSRHLVDSVYNGEALATTGLYIMDFASIIKPVELDFQQLNEEIHTSLESKVPLIRQIGDYIISSGGKRLRPIISLLAARANGHTGSGHIKVAAVVEFLHTSTLLHDDVVDNSQMRRSKPTANDRWGNAAPVLVGDFLLSRAFQLITSLEDLKLLKCLSDSTIIIAEGEVLQLTNIGNVALTAEQYFEIIHHKTAKMFETAAELGALLGDENPNHIEALKTYALELGIAFQLVDDALDYAGDADTMGKNLGDDLQEGKMTLPLIHAYQTLGAEVKTAIEALIKKAQQEALTDADIQQIQNFIADSDALNYTLDKAQQSTNTARQALKTLPESKYTQALSQLAELALARRV